MDVSLQGKNAVLYGGGGALGAAVARSFADAGATVHLVGRTREPLEAAAAQIGDAAHVAVLDALQEDAVNEHLGSVVEGFGSVDVSFDLITRGDVQGTPLLQMSTEDFLRPIEVGTRALFVTACAAARQMVAQGTGGVILTVTSASSAVTKPSPDFSMGGTGPADAAMEVFLRYLAAEAGPHGVRTACLWAPGVSYPEAMGELSLLGRGPTLEQFADAATFVASDRGAGITASIVNVSSGVAGL